MRLGETMPIPRSSYIHDRRQRKGSVQQAKELNLNFEQRMKSKAFKYLQCRYTSFELGDVLKLPYPGSLRRLPVRQDPDEPQQNSEIFEANLS